MPRRKPSGNLGKSVVSVVECPLDLLVKLLWKPAAEEETHEEVLQQD